MIIAISKYLVFTKIRSKKITNGTVSAVVSAMNTETQLYHAISLVIFFINLSLVYSRLIVSYNPILWVIHSKKSYSSQ